MIEAVLTYHFVPATERDYDLEGGEVQADEAASLDERLRVAFWAKLHADVDGRSSALLDKLAPGRLVMLSGWRGAGKSTAIHHAIALARAAENEGVERRTRLAPGTLIHYFDMVALRYRIAETRGSGKNDFCGYVAQILEDRYAVSPEGRRDWLSHLAGSDTAAFRHLRNDVIRSRPDRVADDREGDAFSFSPAEMDAQAQAISDALRRYDENDGEVRLYNVLAWLKGAGRPVCLIVDNVDQLPSAFQERIGRHLCHLVGGGNGPLSCAVVSVRPSSEPRVRKGLDGCPATSVKVVRAESDESLGTAQIRQVLAKRLDYLSELDLASVAAPEELQQSADQRRLGTPERLQTFARRVAAYMHATSTSDDIILSDLVAWHNGSCRHVMTSLAELVESLLLDDNPVVAASEVDGLLTSWAEAKSARSPARTDRLARTLVYRQLTVGEMLSGRHRRTELPTTLFFAEGPTLEASLPYSPAFLLLVLVGSSQAQLAMKDALELGCSLGLRTGEVVLAMSQLCAQRPGDDQGLIRIDEARAFGAQGASTEIVEILPAARLMTRSLLWTCEFLFWCAVYHDRARNFLPRRRKLVNVVALSDVAREEFRVEVVYRFLSREVLPRLGQIDSRSSTEGGQATRTLMVDRLCYGFEAFAGNSNVDRLRGHVDDLWVQAETIRGGR